MAAEKKVAKMLSKKRKTAEPAAGQDAEGSKGPKKKKLKAKALEEEVESPAEAAVVPCKR